MDLTMSIVDTYTGLSNMNVAQQLEMSAMKRSMDSFETEAEALVNVIEATNVNFISPDHVDVSI